MPGKQKNLTTEEALDLYFSLPDDADESETECEESDNKAPSDLDAEESIEEEQVSPGTQKRKGKPRKAFTGSPKKRRISTEKSVAAEDDAVAEECPSRHPQMLFLLNKAFRGQHATGRIPTLFF
ncbi:hypothetical protein HPB47_014361 [Ixodes persulcatus]|uniref:Uncharacterized protein n=1 Tax=Ixodes persulcatus TaxID=34615 RepID=A0AC60QWH4_IXOPE|nr:hypothetical protein HPB47_014361 [Ixodes persulcatus]